MVDYCPSRIIVDQQLNWAPMSFNVLLPILSFAISSHSSFLSFLHAVVLAFGLENGLLLYHF
jgi:hypothetical protein